MKIKAISPAEFTTPMLYETFVDTFHENGHEFVDLVENADVIFFDLHSGFAPYKVGEVDAVQNKGIPVVVFDAFDYWSTHKHRPEWHGWDDWKMLNEKALKNQDWAMWLRSFLRNRQVKLYFMRKMSESWTYPDYVRPLELIKYPDHDFPLVSVDELAYRPYDICFIGNATPWRANMVCDLVKAGFKVDYFFPFHRMEHDEWLVRHRQAKLFLEADGGGFGSERPYQLATLSPMLRQRNDQLMAHPWSPRLNCLEAGDYMGNLVDGESMCDQREILDILEDTDQLHSIYLNGIEHLHTNYSAKARSLYILEQMSSVGIS